MGGKTSGAGPLCQLTCRPSRSDGACFRLVSQHRQPPPPPQAACTAPASARQGSVAARRVLTHPAACNRTQAARQSPILHWRKALRCFSHTPAAKPVRQLAGLPDYGPLYGIAGSRLHPDDKQTASRPYRADGASVESAAGGPPDKRRHWIRHSRGNLSASVTASPGRSFRPAAFTVIARYRCPSGSCPLSATRRGSTRIG